MAIDRQFSTECRKQNVPLKVAERTICGARLSSLLSAREIDSYQPKNTFSSNYLVGVELEAGYVGVLKVKGNEMVS